jgi:hypothetical protein
MLLKTIPLLAKFESISLIANYLLLASDITRAFLAANTKDEKILEKLTQKARLGSERERAYKTTAVEAAASITDVDFSNKELLAAAESTEKIATLNLLSTVKRNPRYATSVDFDFQYEDHFFSNVHKRLEVLEKAEKLQAAIKISENEQTLLGLVSDNYKAARVAIVRLKELGLEEYGVTKALELDKEEIVSLAAQFTGDYAMLEVLTSSKYETVAAIAIYRLLTAGKLNFTIVQRPPAEQFFVDPD